MAGEEKICKWFYACPMKFFFERGKLDKYWIENFCFREGKGCRRYELEEKGIPHPDNMLPSGEIDKTL